MRRLPLGAIVIVVWLFAPTSGLPQAPRGVPVIGQMWFLDQSRAKPWEDKFREGLRELGYIEGKNFRMMARYANGDPTRLRPLLDELVALPVDVLLISPRAIGVALEATRTVPIVCHSLDAAVREGLIRNLARPGINITGMYAQNTELVGKRIEITQELLVDLKRVGVLFDVNDHASAAEARAFQALFQTTDISVKTAGVSTAREFEGALKTFEEARSQAVFIADNPLLYMHRDTVIQLAVGRFPVIAHAKDWARSGALFTYSPDFYQMMKRTSIHIDKILKGAKAEDIPVEQAVIFELVINQRVANGFGIKLPQSILVRATEIIQ